MKARLLTIILSLVTGWTAYAQEYGASLQADSVDLTNETINQPSQQLPGSHYHPLSPFYEFYATHGMPSLNTVDAVTRPLSDGGRQYPILGKLGGYVTSTSLPGLMGIESGALSYGIETDRISFMPSVYVNKYGYFGGLTTSLGIGGQLSLRINDNLSITAFGAYYTNAWAANPAIISNMMSSRYGGYGTWNINDKWGLNVGVQRVHNMATNQWQTLPIIMPTFKINGKDAIGIDVGGLLYQIIDYNRNKHMMVNPTIGPPARPQIVIPPRD